MTGQPNRRMHRRSRRLAELGHVRSSSKQLCVVSHCSPVLHSAQRVVCLCAIKLARARRDANDVSQAASEILPPTPSTQRSGGKNKKPDAETTERGNQATADRSNRRGDMATSDRSTSHAFQSSCNRRNASAIESNLVALHTWTYNISAQGPN